MEQNHEQGTFRDLAKYRLDSAKSELQSARILYDAGQLKGANKLESPVTRSSTVNWRFLDLPKSSEGLFLCYLVDSSSTM